MIKEDFKISGVGCALVDYLYQPVNFSGQDFSRYMSVENGDGGLLPGILVFKDEFERFCQGDYFEIRNRLTAGKPPVTLNIGGPCIVSLIHAAQMLHGTAAKVFFYGAKGHDKEGDYIDEGIRNTPLQIGKYKVTDQITPFTDVLSDPTFDNGNGERIFINNIGAAWNLYPDDLDDDFFTSDIVVLGATALVPRIHESMLDILKRAKNNGAFTIVTTVFDSLNEKKNAEQAWPLGESVETYRYVDLLVMDMTEALRLSGQQNIDDAMSFFKKAGVGAVVVTHGAKPTHYFACGSKFVVSEGMLPISAAVCSQLKEQSVPTGDTTGCGDNFAGGVIASVASQLMSHPDQPIDIADAIAMGTASGGFACFYHGGTYFEKHEGEKKSLIQNYYTAYLEQLGK